MHHLTQMSFTRPFLARIGLLGVLCLGTLLARTQPAWPGLCGLNNIVTADILPTGSYLLQVWSVSGKERVTQYGSGLTHGISPQAEASIDNWRVAPSPSGDTLFAAKYRLSPPGKRLAYAVGIAGVGAGNENPFLVASRQFEGFRGHLGFKAQQDNEGFFLGFDHWLSEKFRIQGDLVQVNDGDDLLSSVGFLHVGDGKSMVQGWVQFNSAEGGKAAFVLYYDYFL